MLNLQNVIWQGGMYRPIHRAFRRRRYSARRLRRVAGRGLNTVDVWIARRPFTGVLDVWLQPVGCSLERAGVVSAGYDIVHGSEPATSPGATAGGSKQRYAIPGDPNGDKLDLSPFLPRGGAEGGDRSSSLGRERAGLGSLRRTRHPSQSGVQLAEATFGS